MVPVTLYPHQKKFLDECPDNALLAWDVGTGKSLAAILWMEKKGMPNNLIIVPKNIKAQWQRQMVHYRHIPYTILTKEEFKGRPIEEPVDCIIFDEADYAGSMLFGKGRSNLAEHLYNTIKRHGPMVLLMTATPFRNAPHTIHTLLAYIDKAPLWKQWQARCYDLLKLPYLPRLAWVPRDDWRKFAVAYAHPRMYTAKTSDIVSVPTQNLDVIRVPVAKLSTVDMKNGGAFPPVVLEGAALWHERARAENGPSKLAWIKEYIRGKSKVVIVCRYKIQIAEYAKELARDREVYVLTGDTKDADALIQAARESFEGVLIVQADLGAGFELPEYSHMIFASCSFSHRSFVQMKGRILRINAMHENWYTVLLGGKCDESVWERLEQGKDFELNGGTTTDTE
jgi:superfamily II DNA or RNA helicase